jgi:catechol 2,3-dioxygenase-like lactoylglutathione lyase family enzyme
MDSSRRAFIKRAIGVSTSAAAIVGASHAAAQTAGVRGFDHVAVPMQNVEAMLAFYRSIGFQVNEGAQVCSVHFGSNMINFHRPVLWQSGTFTLRAPEAKPPCGDFCFVWGGGADALKALLGKIGAKVETGPVNRQGGRQITGSSTYIRDPDQNLLEFIIYPE